MAKKALITGITGQDGSYLAELLLEKGYEVHGVKRRTSIFNTSRIDHLFEDPYLVKKSKFKLHYGDVTDFSNISNLLKRIKPDEVYNLAAQSHVAISFEIPEYTAQVNALGTLKILEAIRLNGLEKKTKFYQASTSELFGQVMEIPQKETTPFYPKSPYAISKLFAFWTVINYREAYNVFACNGILFNHESPRRGENFVTRKITSGLAKLYYNKIKYIYLGNLNAKRDWGHAKDYVFCQWQMLQQKKPKDFIISSGKNYSIRQFIEICCKKIGINIIWSGKRLNEVGKISPNSQILKKNKIFLPNQIIIKVHKDFYRPSEVNELLGDYSYANKNLKWVPKKSLSDLCDDMMNHDLNLES